MRAILTIGSILLALVCHSANAKSFNFDLYYDSEKEEKLDISLTVTLSGEFNSQSRIEKVEIWGTKKSNKVLLFEILNRDLEVLWINQNTVKISMQNTMQPKIKKIYYPIHSDTQIESDQEYDFTDLVINELGTLAEDDSGFFLANQTVQEMALNGFLKISPKLIP